MALPAGINGKTVTFGPGTFYDGLPVYGRVTVTAPKNLVHVDSGRPLYGGDIVRQFVDGAATFDELVPNDAPGLSSTDWTYHVRFEVRGAKQQPEPFDFAIRSDAPSVIDGDKLVAVEASDGTPVSLLAVQIPADGTAGKALTYDPNHGVTWGDVQPPGDYATRSEIPAAPSDIGAQPAGDYATTPQLIAAVADATYDGGMVA